MDQNIATLCYAVDDLVQNRWTIVTVQIHRIYIDIFSKINSSLSAVQFSAADNFLPYLMDGDGDASCTPGLIFPLAGYSGQEIDRLVRAMIIYHWDLPWNLSPAICLGA